LEVSCGEGDPEKIKEIWKSKAFSGGERLYVFHRSNNQAEWQIIGDIGFNNNYLGVYPEIYRWRGSDEYLKKLIGTEALKGTISLSLISFIYSRFLHDKNLQGIASGTDLHNLPAITSLQKMGFKKVEGKTRLNPHCITHFNEFGTYPCTYNFFTISREQFFARYPDLSQESKVMVPNDENTDNITTTNFIISSRAIVGLVVILSMIFLGVHQYQKESKKEKNAQTKKSPEAKP